MHFPTLLGEYAREERAGGGRKRGEGLDWGAVNRRFCLRGMAWDLGNP